MKYNNTFGIRFKPDYYLTGLIWLVLQGRKHYKEQFSARSYTRTKIEANVNVTKAYYQVLVSNEQIKVLLDANIAQLKQQLRSNNGPK